MTGGLTQMTEESAAVLDAVPSDRPEAKPSPASPSGLPKPLLLAAGSYLALSLMVWWNAWSNHPASTTTCGCGDSSTFIWYLEWPAYAISHGLNPLYSTAIFHPGGVNLLSNTSEVAIGVVLAPISWIFGPIATFNVTLMLSPVLSALAMFVLLRRWVTWAPAAFIGGLFYGFSSFILVYLADGHLMLGMAVVPPLFVACLDELLVRQRVRPVVTGLLLGLLVTLQFFIGTEVLLIMVATGFIGVVLVVAYAAVRHPSILRQRARYAVVGLTAGVITALVLLAYPLWFALDGPARLSGAIWPDSIYAFAQTPLKEYFLPAPARTGGIFGAGWNHRIGGYQGPILSSHYFGLGIIAVVIGGIIVWRRDRRLWLFGSIAIITLVLSLGAGPNTWMPWHLLSNLPQFNNVIAERFVLITYLAVAVMLALVVQHTYEAVNRRRDVSLVTPPVQAPEGRSSRLPRWSGSAAGLIVGAIAIVPPAVYLAQSVPMTTQPVVLPTWFQTVAPQLNQRQVLLVLPTPSSGIKSADAWQAVDGMPYSAVGGPGPGAVLARAGKQRRAQVIIAQASVSAHAFETVTTSDVDAVQKALRHWGTTMVVIPDQPDLPAYDQLTSVTNAAALITAATRQRPIHQANAWVWTAVNHAAPAAIPTGSRFSHCTAGLPTRGIAAVDAATKCVLASVGGASGP